MYKLPMFGASALDLQNTLFSKFMADTQTNFQALADAVGDVSIVSWGGRSGKAAGTVVAISTLTLNNRPTVVEAFDTNNAGLYWRTRAIGVLLTNFPTTGDIVRVRHIGRVTVDKSVWTGLTRAGQVVYLKKADVAVPADHGLMTTVPSETYNSLPIGITSYGPHVIFRPKLVL